MFMATTYSIRVSPMQYFTASLAVLQMRRGRALRIGYVPVCRHVCSEEAVHRKRSMQSMYEQFLKNQRTHLHQEYQHSMTCLVSKRPRRSKTSGLHTASLHSGTTRISCRRAR